MVNVAECSKALVAQKKLESAAPWLNGCNGQSAGMRKGSSAVQGLSAHRTGDAPPDDFGRLAGRGGSFGTAWTKMAGDRAREVILQPTRQSEFRSQEIRHRSLLALMLAPFSNLLTFCRKG